MPLSSRVWWWTIKRDEAWPPAGVSTLRFLQCFDTAGGVTGGHPVHKNSVSLIPKGSPPEQVQQQLEAKDVF